MGFSLGTGFLYNWGNGISGEQFIPANITGILFSGIAVGENFNASAAIIQESTVTVIEQKRKDYGRFRFEIFNPYREISPIDRFEKISTIYTTGLENTGVSKENFLQITTIRKDENIILNRGLIVSGVSGNNSISTFISSKRNGRNYLSGNSWLQYSGDFYNNNFTGFQNDDAGIIIRDIGLKSLDNTIYEINYGVDPSFVTGSGKNSILFKNLNIEYPSGISFDASNQKAWASYQLTSKPEFSGYENLNNLNFRNTNFVSIPGTINSSQNVFAYAFEFVDIVTLRDSGSLVISGEVEDPFENLRKLEDPKISTGFDTSFSNYLGYCFTRQPCPEVKDKEFDDVSLCWTGQGSEPPPTSRANATGTAYLRFLSGVRETFKSQGVQKSTFDGFSDLTLSSGVLVSGLFKQQTGQIIYNSFFSGDTISFKLYPFDYINFYKRYHLGNNPLFPETGFTLRFPQDFSGIDNLVNVLNNRLSGISYPVWYPYACLSGESTGIYITGGLMSFEKDLTFETGNKNYNNVIKFKSLRNYESGFQLFLNLVDRAEFIQDLELQYFRKGFSYLIPDIIELQAKTGNQWLILDRRENLYNQLTGLERTLKPINANPELFLDESSESWLSSSEVTGAGTGFSFFDFEEFFLQGSYLELNKFIQKGFEPGKVPPYCPGAEGESFEREIAIVTPVGWPVGVNGCDPKFLEEGAPCPEPIIPFCDLSKGCFLISGRDDLGCPTVSCNCPETKENLELFLSVLRTGWKLELTGQYLNCLTGPDYDPNKIQFSEYRFVARNFSGLKPVIQNQYLIPKQELYFTNINLFSLKPSGIGMHEGAAKCLIGSDYEAQVQDIVSFPLNIVFNYNISGEDFSGIYKALNQITTYTPTESERNTKFIRKPGKIVGDVTGLVNGDFTGRNIIEHTFIGSSPSGYFYNPETKEVYFTQKVTGFFERSGVLNTGIFVLKEEVINFELLAGGRLDTTPQYIEVSRTGTYTGFLFNRRYFQTGAQGIYNLTGEFPGVSRSGFFNILIPTGTRYTGDGFIEPFVSGRIFSGSPLLLQAGFESIVKPFPSEDFISGNFSTLNSLVSGDFITSNNYIFRSPNNFSVFIINTGIITGTILNNVFPFPNELAVTGFGEYRDPNGFVFRNIVQTLMTGNFLVQRSDKSCFNFWPEISYPLQTIATITGFTSNSFVSGRTGIVTGYSGNLLINKGSFALLTGLTGSKEMYAPLSFVQGETILIENKNILVNGGERIKGRYVIKNIITGNQNTNFTGLQYVFSCLKDNDVIFNSPANKNVYITSTGNLIGRPVFATQALMNSTPNKPFLPIPTGFNQASIDVSFDFNKINVFDKLSINNTTISYHPDSSFYPAPDFFNNLDSLLSTINSNPTIFSLTGKQINNTGINFIALDNLSPGDSGNNIQISTTSTGIFIPSNFLTGGKTFYPVMSPTSLFSGFAYGSIGVTGIFMETGSGIISGFIPQFTGVRTFTGIWNIKSGFNNDFRSYFANNLISGNKYFSSQLFENEYNIVQLLLSYNNELNVTEDILDVAELKIKDLNYNKIFPTGNPDITGEIIFRITGIKTL